jgi:hypothetical protein
MSSLVGCGSWIEEAYRSRLAYEGPEGNNDLIKPLRRPVSVHAHGGALAREEQSASNKL